MASLSAPPKGHRRVKSLVREFDEIVTKPGATSPPASPDAPPTQGHVRRSQSVSYSTSPSTGSPNFPYNPPAGFSSSNSMLQTPLTRGPPSGTAGAHKRRASVQVMPITVLEGDRLGAAEGMGLEEVREEEEEGAAFVGAHAEEEGDDVFLPMSPSSAAPYTVNFSNGTTPFTPNFPRGPGGEHARKHSRIHERNLSAFFPRPGQQATGYGDTYEDPNGSGRMGGVSEVPSAPPSNGFPQVAGWGGLGNAPTEDDAEDPSKSKDRRRGHHHRHSLSHNFFSFLDPTQTNSDLASLPQSPYTRTSLSGPSSYPPFTPVAGSTAFLPVPSQALRSKYSHLPAPLRLIVFSLLYLPLGTKLALALSVAQIVMGAMLWVQGQSGESLAVTGLGYLVVFDGMGGLSGVLVEGGAGIDLLWSLLGGSQQDQSVRMPFGSRRLVTLSHFSQAIYLLFSAVYVLKESVEHVLLLHGPAEGEGAHGAGHGGMGHDAGGFSTSSLGVDPGIMLPVTLLALSALASLVSAIALLNHQTLTDAVGPSGLSFSRPRSRSTEPSIFDLVGNPFTLTILIFSVGLVVSWFTIPAVQLAPLDKVVALLQSIAMFYIAYPAAVATGQVLLQTSPPPEAGQMNALTSSFRDIENHPLVTSVSPPHIWQLTPHPPISSTPKPSPTYRRGAPPKDEEASTLIATLVVRVKNDASDDDILSITKFARERCSPALRWGSEERGERRRSSVGRVEPGELTVSVVREKRGVKVAFYDHASMRGEKEEGHGHLHAVVGGGHHH